MAELINFDDKLLQLVKEQLPGLQAEAIINIVNESKRLTELNKTNQEIISRHEETIKNQNKQIQEQRSEISNLKEKIRTDEELELNKLLVEEEKRNLSLKIMEVEKKAAVDRSNDIFNLVNIVFKNPTRITREFSSNTVSGHCIGNGNYVSEHTNNQNKNIVSGDDA